MPALLVLMLLAAPVTDPRLEELERAYQQACDTRIFGQYDDICGSLRDQIAQYRAELRRKPPPKPSPAAAPSTAPPETVGAPPPEAHEPVRADSPR